MKIDSRTSEGAQEPRQSLASSSAGQPVLTIAGLRQVIGIPGTRDTFTLHVAGRLEFQSGAFVGILGQTGCGKTTLLTVLGLLRGATAGSTLDEFQMSFRDSGAPVNLKGIWSGNRSGEANRLRRRHLGFALQNGELLPSLTVAENIAFPLCINGWPRRRLRDRVDYLVNAFRLYRSFDEPEQADGNDVTSPPVEGAQEPADGRSPSDASAPTTGTSSLASVRVNHLSGGQYQRVALARAVAHQPEFLFVDEPTASLNRGVARIALQQLAALRSEGGAQSTVFMVTHDELFAKEFCDVVVRMQPRTPAKDESSEPEGASGEVVFNSQEQ